METKTNTFAADEVKRLELRVAAADVEIKEAASRKSGWMRSIRKRGSIAAS